MENNLVMEKSWKMGTTNKVMEIERFDFLFIFVMNTHDDLLCLPSWHHRKQRKLAWKSHGILLCDLNPVGSRGSSEREHAGITREGVFAGGGPGKEGIGDGEGSREWYDGACRG